MAKSEGETLTDTRDLVAYLEGGCKSKTDWRIGTEHEKFAFHRQDNRPLDYSGPRGIEAILTRMQQFGWKPQYEADKIVALEGADGSSITLEPGGQLELSGAPLPTVHHTCEEVQEHLRQMRTVCKEMDVGLLGLGHLPKWSPQDVPWVPKARYALMREYMPTRGTRGTRMMTQTCTVQVNLDFASEADMVRKMQVSLALQPIVTALFANSPFAQGKPTGYASYRGYLWEDVDPDRCGDLPIAFSPGFGFEQYVAYALEVPMYFVYRDGVYHDARGQSFRDFLKGRLPACPGLYPTRQDFIDHLTIIFTDVRLKTFIEMRGADSGPWQNLCALPALWVGLLYDDQALTTAADMVADWTAKERADLRVQAVRRGLQATFRQAPLATLACQVIDIARQGLTRRARQDGFNASEAPFLDQLARTAQKGQSPAQELLAAYQGPWQQQIDAIYRDHAY